MSQIGLSQVETFKEYKEDYNKATGSSWYKGFNAWYSLNAANSNSYIHKPFVDGIGVALGGSFSYNLDVKSWLQIDPTIMMQLNFNDFRYTKGELTEYWVWVFDDFANLNFDVSGYYNRNLLGDNLDNYSFGAYGGTKILVSPINSNSSTTDTATGWTGDIRRELPYTLQKKSQQVQVFLEGGVFIRAKSRIHEKITARNSSKYKRMTKASHNVYKLGLAYNLNPSKYVFTPQGGGEIKIHKNRKMFLFSMIRYW